MVDGTYQYVEWSSHLNKDNTTFFHCHTPNTSSFDTKVYCDKLPYQISADTLDTECIRVNNGIQFRLNKNKFSSTDYSTEITSYLQQNPITVVYKLETPTYELIEQSNLAISSYSNGHLDLASAVPVSKVNFLHFEEELTYLYPSTSYTIQFISDKAITIDITLGGTQLLAQNIVIGLNRITITTPSELVDNKLVISGVGANIREIVVTDTDRKFMYFEGMKSVGECEELEVMSRNENLFDEKNCIITARHTWHYVNIQNIPTVIFNVKGYAQLQSNHSKLEFYTTNKLPTKIYDEWQLKGTMDVPYNIEGNIRFNVNNNLNHKYLIIFLASTNLNNYIFILC